MKKLKPAAEGAAEERRLWMRKVRSLFRDSAYVSASSVLVALRAYGENRVKRNKKKVGGL